MSAAEHYAGLDPALQAPMLTAKEKLLRDAFVVEYLKDYDHEKAALRIGFDYAFANDFGVSFLRESYVQCKISELESDEINNDFKSRLKSKVIRQLIEESNKRWNKGSERITALVQLSRILGIEQPSNPGKDLPPGGVMVVPVMGGVDDWANVAAQSQKQLKETVRE